MRIKVKNCNFGRVTLSSAKGEKELEFYVIGDKITVGKKRGVLKHREEKEMKKVANLILKGGANAGTEISI